MHAATAANGSVRWPSAPTWPAATGSSRHMRAWMPRMARWTVMPNRAAICSRCAMAARMSMPPPATPACASKYGGLHGGARGRRS
ncbi:hypothetical protein G6F54_013884 [Rhizopus delemar]|nr:hypothetical protein G6F54_013884 [Rhizopus delemar]